MTAATPIKGCACDSERCTLPRVDDRHGLPSTYKNYHCHCRRCRNAWSLYWRQWLHADPARYERERQRRRARYVATTNQRQRVAA